jgi:hypothetical protein
LLRAGVESFQIIEDVKINTKGIGAMKVDTYYWNEPEELNQEKKSFLLTTKDHGKTWVFKEALKVRSGISQGRSSYFIAQLIVESIDFIFFGDYLMKKRPCRWKIMNTV